MDKPANGQLAAKLELAVISELRPHNRNYRDHPEDQLAHIRESIKTHGFYRPVVVARDGTILAGHGIVLAAQQLDIERIPAVRLDVDSEDPDALRLLVGDNEISRTAMIDDRALTEMLREIKEIDVSLLVGTGYSETMLANLVFITRPETEINRLQDAQQWVGLPGFESIETPRLVVSFDDEAGRDEFMAMIGTTYTNKKQGLAWSIWWPPRSRANNPPQWVEEE